MRGRTGGAPSTRQVKLVYYYFRLVIVLLTGVTRQRSRSAKQAAMEPRGEPEA